MDRRIVVRPRRFIIYHREPTAVAFSLAGLWLWMLKRCTSRQGKDPKPFANCSQEPNHGWVRAIIFLLTMLGNGMHCKKAGSRRSTTPSTPTRTSRLQWRRSWLTRCLIISLWRILSCSKKYLFLRHPQLRPARCSCPSCSSGSVTRERYTKCW